MNFTFRLAAHFDAAVLGPSLYLVEWVLTLFAKALPLEPVRRGAHEKSHEPCISLKASRQLALHNTAGP